VEAARSALERGIEVRCIDLSSDYPEVFDPVPDSYAMSRLGYYRYCRMVLERPVIRTEQDDQRERAMAFHLQQMGSVLQKKGKQQGDQTILVLCGFAHVKGLVEQLKRSQARPFDRRPGAKLYHLSTGSLGEIMGNFPFLTAVYELRRSGLSSPQDAGVHEASVTDEFDRLAPDTVAAAKRALQIIDGKKPEGITEFVERAQRETAAEITGFDRHDILTRFVLWCRAYYEREVEDRINPHNLFLLENFSRKYAAAKNMLLPDFFELLIAGRSCVNSHFCYRMWEIGTSYQVQHGPSELEIIELRAGDLFPLVQKLRMNPNAPLRPRAGIPRFLRRSEKQKKLKEDRQFHPFSICSYQPEDIVIEDYARYLRKKGKSILTEERKRVHPFETSLLDGIDLRETIRNWYTGKIYVQENMVIRGGVDSLVVIFDEDGSKYPYTMTWLGEHNQESDMAFYATNPEERPAGPGIRKAVYGGLMMTMPPGRLFDVFGDPSYRNTGSHAERLLLAAIDYGFERFVLYAAPKPPRPLFQVIAGRYGKRILYIPLAQLSPVMLQKIRTFHILSDKSVRDYAKDYIW
jgi:hypothetical protein